MNKTINTPAPQQVTEVRGESALLDLGLQPDEFPNDRVWLAKWADRSGWYVEGLNPDHEACRFWSYCGNDTCAFATAAEVQAWLFERVEHS